MIIKKNSTGNSVYFQSKWDYIAMETRALRVQMMKFIKVRTKV